MAFNMTFFDRYNKQRREVEREWEKFREDERKRVEERVLQDRKNFEEWHARDLLPVWRNWERLEVARKLDALKKSFPDQVFSLVILKTGVSTTPKSKNDEFSWSDADASGGKVRHQKRRFRSDDFTFDKVLVATPGAPTKLGATVASESNLYGESRYFKYITVEVDKERITIVGRTLPVGVSVREFDDILLQVIKNPGEGRTRDPS